MGNNDYNIWEGKTEGPSQEVYQSKNEAIKYSADIDFKRLIGLWPFVLMFAIIGYSVGKIILRYVTPIYTVSTSITLEEEKTEETELEQLLGKKKKNSLVDKIAYFKSPNLVAKLVDTLGLQYHSEAQGKFKKIDYYGQIKWRVLSANENNKLISFSITPKLNGFHYTSGTISGNAYWGIPFNIADNRIVVERLKTIPKGVLINCYNDLKFNEAFRLSASLYIAAIGQGSALIVSYTDINSDRAIDILNVLLDLQKVELEKDKSIGFSKTIDFIDKRLGPLANDLDSIEASIAEYKIAKGIIGTTGLVQGYEQIIKNAHDGLEQLRQKESVLKGVEEFINNPKHLETDLEYIGIEGTNLASLCSKFEQLRKDREKLTLVAQDANPKLRMLDKNITEVRRSMDRELLNYKNSLRISKSNLEQQLADATLKLSEAPSIEMELSEKLRFKSIKEALYSSLLQKKEEAMMSKASVNVDNKLIYPPLKSNATIRPSKEIVLSVSTVIGFLIPLIFGVIREVTNKKIITKKNLQNNTNLPILAELEHVSKLKTFPFAVGGNNRSMFGEQIRSLRTNMNFYLNQEKPTNYILLTSSMSGEGKSFLAMNIAKSYSLQGKKVALLEFDLRRPKITSAIGLLDIEMGLSTFLIGKASVDEIVHTIVKDEDEHLDLFPSGSIPPNPQELISSKYMKVLKDYLDKNYEIVVIDSPPFGIVADAQILSKYTDITLIVTRFNLTTIDQIKEINSWSERKIFKSMAMVFNGVKNSGYFGYHYGGNYYYRRKYGYGYYGSYYGYVSDKKNKRKNT